MKIKSIETFSTGYVTIVRVRSTDGHEGFGQTAPYHANITALIVHQQLSRHVLGKEIDTIDQLVEDIMRAEHKYYGSYLFRALSGLETALWDLKGKQLGKSVCELLGGEHRPIEVYGSSMRRNISPEEESERLKRIQQEYGIRAFKFRIGNNFGNDVDVYPGRTEQIIPTVRKALGEETLLYADANSAFTPTRAIEIGRLLEQYGLVHYEEPCPFPNLEWTKQVTEELDIAVAGGEQDTDLVQFQRMINMKAVDIVQPDICYIGGLSRAIKVANMAEEAGMICMPHSANLSMISVFTMHLTAAIPNAGQFMEYSIETRPWEEELFTSSFNVSDGKVKIPDGPGWGVQIRPEWLDKATYQISESKYEKTVI
ncbi:mandelate racemase/muconate lactonizing enzyme family protein [Bacillus sp. EB106-08-02-XG196]|jgi:L-alanine-DL-glutamate epimerase-like enolase superfamily enzyme|uniref:mandelate racemase/muconate lactonizing enzyme family protein n=1 Tax=Bacillus sp. EB106-08-02-XG196 TaxID=2737049 RepID=UPI0015C4E159|nr:mandelate racemase/muconate lactonizing enzyme family protein [Bacillus sp. EB106-08-02-XG196]NWQ40317.1 mandelate racemase/muconate lactonizing enzyme family protein [Bacillus sp. EB106-08-02-XG196]